MGEETELSGDKTAGGTRVLRKAIATGRECGWVWMGAGYCMEGNGPVPSREGRDRRVRVSATTALRCIYQPRPPLHHPRPCPPHSGAGGVLGWREEDRAADSPRSMCVERAKTPSHEIPSPCRPKPPTTHRKRHSHITSSQRVRTVQTFQSHQRAEGVRRPGMEICMGREDEREEKDR